MTGSTMVVRKCHTLDEMSACVDLQKEVWNFTDAELVPLRVFVVAEKIGGQVIGAFDEGKMVAFALSLPGSRGGHSYLHSQMLAVRHQYRNAGLGRQIKLFQRDDALARGFELIEWTFDPLEIKNAYLNIERLGAIARRYHVNQYGITSSPLQGGLPSDRLVAEWWLKSKRVETLLRSATQAGICHAEDDFGSVANLRMEGIAGQPGAGSRGSGVQPQGFSAGLFRWAGGAGLRTRSTRSWQVSAGALGGKLDLSCFEFR